MLQNWCAGDKGCSTASNCDYVDKVSALIAVHVNQQSASNTWPSSLAVREQHPEQPCQNCALAGMRQVLQRSVMLQHSPEIKIIRQTLGLASDGCCCCCQQDLSSHQQFDAQLPKVNQK